MAHTRLAPPARGTDGRPFSGEKGPEPGALLSGPRAALCWNGDRRRLALELTLDVRLLGRRLRHAAPLRASARAAFRSAWRLRANLPGPGGDPVVRAAGRALVRRTMRALTTPAPTARRRSTRFTSGALRDGRPPTASLSSWRSTRDPLLGRRLRPAGPGGALRGCRHACAPLSSPASLNSVFGRLRRPCGRCRRCALVRRAMRAGSPLALAARCTLDARLSALGWRLRPADPGGALRDGDTHALRSPRRPRSLVGCGGPASRCRRWRSRAPHDARSHHPPSHPLQTPVEHNHQPGRRRLRLAGARPGGDPAGPGPPAALSYAARCGLSPRRCL
jgi:hypothetical protein